MFKPSDLFERTQTEHAALFEGCEHAWDALKKIKAHLAQHLRPGLHHTCVGGAWGGGEHVFIGAGTVVGTA